jgi:hypothetical protein
MWWLIVLVLVAGIVYYLATKKEGLAPTFPSGFIKYPADFGIYNYLGDKVTVKITTPDHRKKILGEVPSNTRVGVDKEDVIAYLVPDAMVDIYVGDANVHYSSILVNTAMLERIKNLHVGMITSRFIGKTTDTLRMATVADNALQGNAWLKIHNLTDMPLRLHPGLEPLTAEHDIDIPPHSEIKYLGYRHQGVTLGTYFKDPSGLYPIYQHLTPNGDLYYGVVSDLKQPLEGCFQLEYNDDCDPNQTLWPFEMGQM